MARPPPRLRAYFAMSLDGMIADEKGDIGWLAPFEQVEVGFDGFLDSITSIAMGRRTYDQVLTFGEWPYAGKDVIVVTSRPLVGAPRGVRAFAGTPKALARQITGGDMWIMGGAMLFNAMLRAGYIERLQLFIVPVVLGQGIALFNGEAERDGYSPEIDLKFRAAESYPMGMVELVYDVFPRR